jgi:hypothetical protein
MTINNFEVNSLTPFAPSAKTAIRCLLNGGRFACFAVFMTVIAFGGAAQAAIISQYSFADVVAGQLNRAATTVHPDATAGDITNAPLVNGNPTVVLSRLNGVAYATQPSLAATRAAFNEANDIANVYFTFEVSPNSGLRMNLDDLTFNVARGGAAVPRTYDVRSSVDGFAASLVGGPVQILTVRPNFTPVSIDLSGAAFQDLASPVTFRIHYMGQPGQFGQAIDFDDITLNGELVPEPGALTLLAVAGGWMFRRRRER